MSDLTTGPRTLVLYAYYETAEYRENLRFFLRHGLDDESTFIFIINGGLCSEPLPARGNSTVVRRANLGSDFGAWNEALAGADLEAYDCFIFVNCTVRGPFLPVWAAGTRWTRVFTNLLDYRTKLVGTTLNYHYGHPHLQSMLLCTDRAGLRIAYDAGIFGGETVLDKPAIGLQREIAFSEVVLQQGFRIRSLMAAYALTDWRTARGYRLAANAGGVNTVRVGDYFGTTPHPFEVVFVKSAARQGTDIDLLTSWADGAPPSGPLADCQFDLEGYERSFHRIVPASALVVGEPDDAILDFLARLFDIWASASSAAVHVLTPTGDGKTRSAPHRRVHFMPPGLADAGGFDETVGSGGLVVVDASAAGADLEASLFRHAGLVSPGCFLVIDRTAGAMKPSSGSWRAMNASSGTAQPTRQSG